ncbi:MAG TPA: hypothetical protein PLN21_05880 [Gemmatales bacterium]|nr:hypothetical protein [Gemmatales bacterium]
MAIMTDDASSVAASIGEMVKWNRRQEQMNSSMQKLVCLTAHAYYNVCRRVFIPRGVAPPVIPNESTWDAEFQELVQAGEGGTGFFDFSLVNASLARCMNELPISVTLEDVLAHVS